MAARQSLECAAIQDVLVVGKALEEAESQNRKTELDRMAAMLSRLGGRGYRVREDTTVSGVAKERDATARVSPQLGTTVVHFPRCAMRA